MIDGKLTEMDRDPRNVQVVVARDGNGRETLSLKDVDGVFVDAGGLEEPEEVGTGGVGRGNGRGGSESEESDPTPSERGGSPAAGELDDLRTQNAELTAHVSSLEGEVSRLGELLKRETERVSEMWRMSCAQVVGFDEAITAKDTEIELLRARISELEASVGRRPMGPALVPASVPTVHPPGPVTSGHVRLASLAPHSTHTSAPARRGKAPPVNEFSGEDPECLLEDWLPSLERVSLWNAWSEEEQMIQLAGHLKGRALQEWNLLHPDQRSTFTQATEALRSHLDTASKVVAAQDFRHTAQRDEESVSDFIHRLERTFRAAYGRDAMSIETRDTLLYGQFQDGLSLQLMQGPAVSGARNYAQLCIAAKNEEKRLADLKKRREYAKLHIPTTSPPRRPFDRPRQSSDTPDSHSPMSYTSSSARPPGVAKTNLKCFYCGKPGHKRDDCRKRKSDIAGLSESRGPGFPVTMKQIRTGGGNSSPSAQDEITTAPVDSPKQTTPPPSGDSTPECRKDEEAGVPERSPLSLLLSDSEEEVVKQVHVSDGGSCSQLARVDIYGIPADGVVDTAADITIMGGKLFALVAAVAKLRKKNFKKPDKVPRNYDGREFHLDGCMEMEITFEGKTLTTKVYIKMDAVDQLLLSEGVCRQLGMVTYHPSLVSRRTPKRKEVAAVPSIRVSLVQSLKLPPSQSALVPIRLDSCAVKEDQTLLIEGEQFLDRTGLVLENAVVSASRDGTAHLVITNMTGFTQRVPEGTVVGDAQIAEVVTTEPGPIDASSADVRRLSSSQDDQRRKKLLETLQLPDVPQLDSEQLRTFLANSHDVFSLEEGERGETPLVTMGIDTGDTPSKKQPPRRMPFMVREEVAKQLKSMQRDGVIQPSNSPWSSPVVMVRKKDGSHRFCVDYRALNSVTKADTYPLPRIDDLLDQLNGARYFSTLDLASGFWQVQMEPASREKTAFVTPHGLYEFLVMPFGLTNAPAVFQRLMQKVLNGLNPESGKQFVVAYLDDILIFSETLQDHLTHLQKVINRLKTANLKLKPTKCMFMRKELEYLGHVITAEGLKPNLRITEAVRNFPTPENVPSVRRFLGMASYYRRFIAGFAKTAQPLHQLTAKNVPFQWSPECETAFVALKDKLVTPPVLAYPRFGEGFTLETDASISGLGAVLSQKQADGRLHPVAYASRALNPTEKNYSVTELETLAVVWGITHFHSYLYGGDVTVITDHSAVKPVLEAPNPAGKHARWWTRVHGTGIKSVKIVYRAGRENASADALSRSPVSLPPAHGIG